MKERKKEKHSDLKRWQHLLAHKRRCSFSPMENIRASKRKKLDYLRHCTGLEMILGKGKVDAVLEIILGSVVSPGIICFSEDRLSWKTGCLWNCSPLVVAD